MTGPMPGREPFGGWSLPFAEQDTSPMHDARDAIPSGGLVVMAATLPTPLGTFPVLIFRFEDGNREYMRPIALVMPAEQLRDLPALITASVAAAIRRAGGQ